MAAGDVCGFAVVEEAVEAYRCVQEAEDVCVWDEADGVEGFWEGAGGRGGIVGVWEDMRGWDCVFLLLAFFFPLEFFI